MTQKNKNKTQSPCSRWRTAEQIEKKTVFSIFCLIWLWWNPERFSFGEREWVRLKEREWVVVVEEARKWTERESDVNKNKVMKSENRKRDADSRDLMSLLCFFNPASKHSCHYVSWLICLIFTDLHYSTNADIQKPEGKKLLWVEKQHLWASQPAYEPSNQLFSFSFIYITSVDNNFVRCLFTWWWWGGRTLI